jgi:hypothetical protein
MCSTTALLLMLTRRISAGADIVMIVRGRRIELDA